MVIYGYTQHAGLAENVLDHRLNCRTVYMNAVNRYLYWNMNYHVEHHMFPLVPYHALPELHELVKADCRTPYHGLLEAYREIIPALLRQVEGPELLMSSASCPRRPSAAMRRSAPHVVHRRAAEPVDGWIEVCAATSCEKKT